MFFWTFVFCLYRYRTMPYIHRHQSLNGLDENLINCGFLIRVVSQENPLTGLSLHIGDFSQGLEICECDLLAIYLNKVLFFKAAKNSTNSFYGQPKVVAYVRA